MTEKDLYEQLGRKQAEIDRRALAYAELLLLLSQVLTGEVAGDRVTVDLARQTWERRAAEAGVADGAGAEAEPKEES